MNLLERAAGAARFEALYSDAALLAAMARFEAELARAQADAGLIAPAAAEAVVRDIGNFSPDAHDLADKGAHAGSLAIPYVQALRAHVASVDANAADLLHAGSTSQDVIDTAVVLCTRTALEVLDREASAAADACRALALSQRDTPMLARTLMQPAGITTFGFKAAQWHHALAQCRSRVTRTASTALAVSLGGATGNLAAYGERGAAVRAALARRLALHDPGHTWHTLRHNWIALACDVALLCGTLAKIAQDIALLAQAEVGEVEEPVAEGRGGSSAMPHKRNPVLCLRILTLSQPVPGMIAHLLSALPQAHERALGAWQAESMQIPTLYRHACAATAALAELMAGLVVRPQRCARNIAALKGVIFAEALTEVLTGSLGKVEAQGLVAHWCRQCADDGPDLQTHARAALASDPRLAAVDPARLDECFDLARAARPAARQVTELIAPAEA